MIINYRTGLKPRAKTAGVITFTASDTSGGSPGTPVAVFANYYEQQRAFDMIYLRQSTASQEIPLGRFVDSADGNTEKSALTIANTDIKIWKNGATTLASKNSGGATIIANGVYYAVLDATDTDTLGPMEVLVHVAGALPVKQACTVLSAAQYDTLFGATAFSTYAGGDTSGTTTLLARLTSGRATNLDNLDATISSRYKSIDSGTPQTISNTGMRLRAGNTVLAKGMTAIIRSSQPTENRIINSCDAITFDCVFDEPLVNTPTGSPTYELIAFGAEVQDTASLPDDTDIAILESNQATLQNSVNSLAAAVATMQGQVNAGVVLDPAYDFAKGTVPMTESYAVPGSPPTPAQCMLAIQQFLFANAVNGVSMTMKKIDNTTIAMTFILDNPTAPLSIQRIS